MNLTKLLNNIPIKDIINSNIWKKFINRDESLVYIGMKVIELTFIDYILNCNIQISLNQLTLLEHKYINTMTLEQIYDLLQLSDIVPVDNTLDKVKQIRAFYGMLYKFETSHNLKICSILTENIFGTFEIPLPQLQDNKTYIIQLLSRLHLYLPDPKIYINGSVRIFKLIIPKQIRNFFEKYNKILPKQITISKFNNFKCASQSAYYQLKEIFDSQLITIQWIEVYHYTKLFEQLTLDEQSELKKYMNIKSIQYFKTKNRFNKYIELYSIINYGQNSSIEKVFEVKLSSNEDIESSKLNCLKRFISDKILNLSMKV